MINRKTTYPWHHRGEFFVENRINKTDAWLEQKRKKDEKIITQLILFKLAHDHLRANMLRKQMFIMSGILQVLQIIYGDGGDPTITDPGGGNGGDPDPPDPDGYPNDGAIIIDPRTLGWLVAEDYGAIPDSNNDMTDESVAAFKASGDNTKPVLFLFGNTGKYKVSNTVYYHHSDAVSGSAFEFKPCFICGQSVGGVNPEFVLADGATGFNSANPKAVIDLRGFSLGSGGDPALNNTNNIGRQNDVFDVPNGWSKIANANVYHQVLRNIDVDCGNNPMATGVCHVIAEDSWMANLNIKGSNYHSGIYGTPARGAGVINIKVSGTFQYGIVTYINAGGSIVGVEIDGATVAAFRPGDFGPVRVVGFKVTLAPGATLWEASGVDNNAPGRDSCVFIDGQVTCGSSSDIALHNPVGKNVYYQNVYVSGTNNIIKNGGLATITQSGSVWKRVVEHAHTDQSNTGEAGPNDSDTSGWIKNESQFPSRALVNGNVLSSAQPITVIENIAGSPPATIVTRHYWATGPYKGLPVYYGQDNGTKIVSDNDSVATINQRLTEAAADGNWVFMIPGDYEISGPFKILSNSILLSTWSRTTTVKATNIWINNAISEQTPRYYIETPNDAAATCFVGFIDTILPNGGSSGGGTSPQDWFGSYRWRAGRNSMLVHITARGTTWQQPFPQSHDLRRWEGNGGGRKYLGDGHMGSGGHLNGQNSNFHEFHFVGNTEPTWLYHYNNPIDNMHHAIQIDNCHAGIRIFGDSREEPSIYLIINNSSNVFACGDARNRREPNVGPRYQVNGTSDNIGFAVLTCQSFNAGTSPYEYMVWQNINGVSNVGIRWPVAVSYYTWNFDPDSMPAHGYQ